MKKEKATTEALRKKSYKTNKEVINMKIGLIYPYDEKNLKQDLKNGEDVGIGIELNQLLDQLGALEVKYAYDTKKILGEVKYEIMAALGKVKLDEPKK